METGARLLLNDTLPRSALRSASANTANRPQLHPTFRPPRDIFEAASRHSKPSIPHNFTFAIRGWGCHAVVNGKVSHTTPDLKAVLHDARGHNILELRKQVPDFIEPSCAPVSGERRAIELKQENTIQKFDVYHGGKRIGLIMFGDREPLETCLKIFYADNSTQLVVRSVIMGEFSVFRDESSTAPLCSIKTDPFRLHGCSYSFDCRGNIEFYSKEEITVEEQQLCTAATFAYKICQVQRVGFVAQYIREECKHGEGPQTENFCPLNSSAAPV